MCIHCSVMRNMCCIVSNTVFILLAFLMIINYIVTIRFLFLHSKEWFHISKAIPVSSIPDNRFFFREGSTVQLSSSMVMQNAKSVIFNQFLFICYDFDSSFHPQTSCIFVRTSDQRSSFSKYQASDDFQPFQLCMEIIYY